MALDVLIVDDEADICDLVGGILSDEGYEPRIAHTGAEALSAIKERQPNLVLLDVWLGDGTRDGLKILETIKRDHAHVPVVMMSGHGTVETAVAAIKLGAYDFIEKPFQTERLLVITARAVESSRLIRENHELRTRAPSICSLVGTSHAILEAKQAIDAAAPSHSRILLTGPVGCDRTAIARYIHNISLCADGPFFALNSASLPASHLEAELFGLETLTHEENDRRKIGLLENAHGGTLFIDEIGGLPPAVQTRLVHFLLHKKFLRVGGQQPVRVDVRIISGASQKIPSLLADGNLREDLISRLGVVCVDVPPLAERTRDIALLAKHFISAIATAQNVSAHPLSPQALAILESYPWPGDVQQFKNILEWVLIMINGTPASDPIAVDDLPPEIICGNDFVNNWNKKVSSMTLMPIKEAREAFERDYLWSQLKRFGGHISQTAKFIGMDRASLHRKLKALGLSADDREDNSEAGAAL